jgi:hypothetical protein
MRRPRFGLVLATMIAVAGMPATAWAQGGGTATVRPTTAC